MACFARIWVPGWTSVRKLNEGADAAEDRATTAGAGADGFVDHGLARQALGNPVRRSHGRARQLAPVKAGPPRLRDHDDTTVPVLSPGFGKTQSGGCG